MENAPLNKAHQQFRKAERHLRHRRFEEAIECHKIAADFLNEALANTQNPRSIESLKLQKDYHVRQKDVILIKKEQYESYKKAMENKKENKQIAVSDVDYEAGEDCNGTSLQMAIYRTMEETDSLLCLLHKRGSGTNSDSESLKSFSATDIDDRGLTIDSIDCGAVLGSKHPKDEATVIEELRILNGQLHALVYKLVVQLDARAREVDTLKEKVKQLESEKAKGISKSSNNLKVVTDSSGGTSPFIFSPCSELSPDVHDNRVIPTLAPLELPSFDIANFVRSNSNPTNTEN